MNVSLTFLAGTSALLKASNALAVRNPDSPEEVELSEEALAKMTMSEVEELIDEKREELIGQAAMTEAILTKLDGTEENAAEAIEIATKKLSGVLQAGSNKLVEDAQARVVAANESVSCWKCFSGIHSLTVCSSSRPEPPTMFLSET